MRPITDGTRRWPREAILHYVLTGYIPIIPCTGRTLHGIARSTSLMAVLSPLRWWQPIQWESVTRTTGWGLEQVGEAQFLWDWGICLKTPPRNWPSRLRVKCML